ncbi:cellulosome enzyme [Nitriliruptoraceae bacterium ZYF776]|nr:cellulosome enzyme [Profundirhabdus halotolerans]
MGVHPFTSRRGSHVDHAAEGGGRPPGEPSPGRRPAARSVALTATVGLVASLLPLAAAGATVADDPEPVLHYTFDDVDGTTVPDASGNGNDGTLANAGSAQIIDGPEGQALVIPGGSPNSGAHVVIPRPAMESAGDLTVSTRFRWHGGGSWQWMYGLGTNSQRYLFTTPSNGDGNLRTALTIGGGGAAEDTVDGSASLPANRWVTHTVVLDADAGELITFLEGAEVSRTSTDISADELLTASASTGGFLGRSFYSQDALFSGAFDELRIYHDALDADQVADLVDEPATPTGFAATTFPVRTTIGSAPSLPAHARMTYSDGYDRLVPIDWDEVDEASYNELGRFDVEGDADGTAVVAQVTVVDGGQLSIDLGDLTGDFLGGASGGLYGIYGDGLPSDNLLEGFGMRTTSTKGQDGAQHPGSDALEVLDPLARTTGGDIYVRTTDYYRGFPYQWPGDTPEERLSGYMDDVLPRQLDQIADLIDERPDLADNIVIEPFNEPEGNMFGTGQWSYNGVSWRTDPTHYFQAWDDAFEMIREKLGDDMRISGPNTSILYNEVYGFMEHAVSADTVPDIITWHELSHPQGVRNSVERYRGWEAEIFEGTAYEGVELPINVNEYAFNYHTSVPGQMIQWISAIEDAKVDAQIAFWNTNGNLTESAVEANYGNGQWWLFNTYQAMSGGETATVHPPEPGENYTLQGVASLDEDLRRARAIVGGGVGPAVVAFDDVPEDLFGDTVHAFVREIPWTGQLGVSPRPRLLAQMEVETNAQGTLRFDFDGEDLPVLQESAAYEIVIVPAGSAEQAEAPPILWEGSYEAEDADHSGPIAILGPEGRPEDVGKVHTSGMYHVSGIRSNSDAAIDFTVDVPEAGTYDLQVYANSHSTSNAVQAQGPTNAFLSVDGDQEQELFLPMGYNFVVWSHTDTTVELEAGENAIRLAAQSLDGSSSTVGDAIVDRIVLQLANPAAEVEVYEAELAEIESGTVVTDDPRLVADQVSGAGAAAVAEDTEVTFWVHSDEDATHELEAHAFGDGSAQLAINGHDVATLDGGGVEVPVSLSGGVNKVTVTGASGELLLDRLEFTAAPDALPAVEIEAEDAELAGDVEVVDLSLASGGQAVDGIGGDPGNGNTVTFEVDAEQAGMHALRVRYSNPERVQASHYNPNPVARPADVSVNGGPAERILFPHSFHQNNFWELTIPVALTEGANEIEISSEELPNWDGDDYADDLWPADPSYGLRSAFAPLLDRVTVVPLHGAASAIDPIENQPPTVEDLALTTTEGTSVEGQLVIDDPDGDEVTVTYGEPGDGTVEGDDTGAFTYTPAAGFVGTDTFAVVVTDEEGLTGEGTVTVTVAPAGDGDDEVLTCPEGAGSGFPDVPGDSPHADTIRCGDDLGIFAGKTDGRFDPRGSLTRGQVATVIDRIATATGHAVTGERQRFPDVATGDVHRDAIERLAGAGVIAGRANGTFGSADPITRGQLAALLVRFIENATGEALPVGPGFPDVDGTYVHEQALRKARQAGIVVGGTDGRAQPTADIRRDQAASLFVRSLEHLPLVR